MLKKIIVIILIVTSLTLAGCQKKTDIQSVRIAFFPNITHAQALYGKNTGKFEEAFGTLPVEWKQFNAGPSEIEAMFAGEVDIGYIGPIPAINAFTKSNGDVKVIAGASNGGAIMVTRRDLVLTSPKEISGLKVAIPQLGNTQHISLLNILSENGLVTKDKGGTVEVVPAENSDIKTLLDQGKIDAALVPEPWGARMINEVGANLFLDEKQVWQDGNYPVACVIVNKDFMEAHPDIVKKFLETQVEITNEINSDPANAKTVINAELLALTQKSLDEKVLDEAFSRVAVTTDINTAAMDDFIKILAIEGIISDGKSQPDLVDTSILNSIKGEK